MNITYKRDFHHSYMILTDDGIWEESYEYEMMARNKIAGLMGCRMQKIDNQALFYYDITSMQPLAMFCEDGKINYDILLILFHDLFKTLEEMEAYLIEPTFLQLSPELIYMVPGGAEMRFCCFPKREHSEEAFQNLAEYLLPLIDHQDQKAVVLGYQFYRLAMENEVCSEQLQSILQGEEDRKLELAFQEGKSDEMLEEGKSELIFDEDGKEEDDCQNRDNLTEINLIEREERKHQESVEAVLREKEEEDEEDISLRQIFFPLLSAAVVIIYLFLLKNEYFSKKIMILAGAFLLLLVLGAMIGTFLKSHKKENSEKGKERIIRRDAKKVDGNEPWENNESDVVLSSEPYSEEFQDSALDILPFKKEKTKIGESSLEEKKKEKIQNIKDLQETSLLSGIEHTSIYLRSLDGDSDIALPERGSLLLGKMKNAVDVPLFSPTVSRIHAKILMDGECHLYDLNSRNGTYVNHEQIDGTGVILHSGDQVTFADVKFCYEDNRLKN